MLSMMKAYIGIWTILYKKNMQRPIVKHGMHNEKLIML